MRANAKRIAALLLTLVLLLGVLPTAAFASGETYKQVTSVEELKRGGQFVLVAPNGSKYLALGTTIGAKIDPVQVTVADGELSGTDIPLWTVASSGDGVSFSNGKTYLAYGNSTSFKSGDPYTWNVTANSNGTFRFTASGADKRAIAYGISQGKFGAYSTTNTSGYVFDLMVYKLAEGEGGSEEITVAAPQAQPGAGEVEAGTTVKLTCATEGAAVYYTLDGSDPTAETNENRSAYADLGGDGITINKDCTLKAAAVKGSVWSAVQVLKYTVKTEEPAETPIADGDHVVIYAPAYKKALSATYNGYYNTGTDVSVAENDTVTGYTDADVWTVIANEDGSWSFAHNGQNIGMGDRYSSMPLGGKNDQWVLEDAGDGLYYIKNTARNVYMEWYAAQNNWSGYGTIAPWQCGNVRTQVFQSDGLWGIQSRPGSRESRHCRRRLCPLCSRLP